jgi:ComF family protein
LKRVNHIFGIVAAILNSLVNYLYPSRCYKCSEFTAEQNGFCSSCWSSLNFISRPFCNICGKQFFLDINEDLICSKCIRQSPPYELSRSLLKFDENSKNIIHNFKYYDKTDLAKVFAKLICFRYKTELEEVDFIIPVPMNKWKRLLRMYNQSYLLALEIARLINKPILPRLLVKTKWTKPQAALTKASREKNLKGSMILKKVDIIKNKRILLVDDVATTGTTILECSRLLKKGGVGSIRVITIAAT